MLCIMFPICSLRKKNVTAHSPGLNRTLSNDNTNLHEASLSLLVIEIIAVSKTDSPFAGRKQVQWRYQICVAEAHGAKPTKKKLRGRKSQGRTDQK
jgi:hypothetical protein